jgi:hypothetical protein
MIRNLPLYPAELRGLRRKQPFGDDGRPGQAEQNGAMRHTRAHGGHNFGHTGGGTI